MAVLKYRDSKGAEHVINPYWCLNVEVAQEKGDNPTATISQEALTKYLNEMDDKIITNISYDEETKHINFYIGEEISAFIDAAPFVKDDVIAKAEVINNVLTLTYNAGSEREPLRVPLTDIFNPDLYYTQVELNRIVADLNGSVEVANGEIVAIKGRLEIFDNKLANLRTDVDRALDKCTEHGNSIKALDAGLNQTNARVTSLEVENDWTHTQVEQLKKEDENLAKRMDNLLVPEDLTSLIDGVEYVKAEKRINFKNGDRIIAFVDTTDFVKDGMVSTVAIVGDALEIRFNTDSEMEPITIPLTDIFNPENYYDKVYIDGQFTAVQAKIDAINTAIDAMKGAEEYQNTQIAQMQERISHDRADLVTLRAEHEAIRSKANANGEAINELQISVTRNTDDLTHLHDDVDGLTANVARKVEHTDFNTTIRNLREELQVANEENATLKTEIETLKNAIKWHEHN